MQERKPDDDEIAILKAIETQDMFLLPKDYHPADLAWLSMFGYIKLSKGYGFWWPEKATLTDKGREAIHGNTQ